MINIIAATRAPARCAYCHSSIDGFFSGCSRCGTACHSDCMEEIGGCPTLGCGPRRQPKKTPRPTLHGVPRSTSRIGSTLRFLLKAFSCLVLGVIALGIMIPILYPNRRCGNETAAIGALKTIGAAQALFRESDKDGNHKPDYAESLKALGDAGRVGLVDKVLASGKKQGYRFVVGRSESNPEFCWYAYAWPYDQTSTRMFVTNHEGVTYSKTLDESRNAVLMIDTKTCEIDTTSGWRPVGR